MGVMFSKMKKKMGPTSPTKFCTKGGDWLSLVHRVKGGSAKCYETLFASAFVARKINHRS